MNAEDAIIAKKRKRAERIDANPVRNTDQGPRLKKDVQKIRKNETIRKQALQRGINSTFH